MLYRVSVQAGSGYDITPEYVTFSARKNASLATLRRLAYEAAMNVAQIDWEPCDENGNVATENSTTNSHLSGILDAQTAKRLVELDGERMARNRHLLNWLEGEGRIQK